MFGSTLSNDRHAGRTFDYLIANPPYGKDWKRDKEAVEESMSAVRRPLSRRIAAHQRWPAPISPTHARAHERSRKAAAGLRSS